ncbi:MAG: glycosyltransferase family 4 protein [Actinomycetota bacterium]|nr:glycosyltransferase family 4 protein [Actinomycetota bacterium]
MRVLVHSLTFPPDSVSTGKLVAEIANGISLAGHDVTVLASTPQYNPNQEAEKEQPLNRISKNFYRSQYKNVKVDHIKSNVRSHKKIRRALQWVRYHLFSVKYFIKNRNSFDTILVFSYPPTMNLVVLFCSLILRKNVIYSLWELYPEVALNLAEVTKGVVSKPFKLIDNLALKKAKVVVNSNELKFYLEKERNIPSGNIEVIYHFSPDDNPKLNHDGIQQLKKTIAYAGNFGKPQDLLSFVHSFNKANDGSWKLLLIGSGAQYEEVETLESETIKVYSYLAKSELNQLLHEIQIMLVALSSKLTVEGFPGKTFDYMSRGKYILGYANPNSSVAKLITNHKVGTNIKPEDHLSLENFLNQVDVEDIKVSSKNAISLSETNFSKGAIVSQYLELLN